MRLDLSNYFQDPDKDELTYTARSDNTNIVLPQVVDTSLIIHSQDAVGSTTVKVTASDGKKYVTRLIFVTVTGRSPEPDLVVQSISVSKLILTPGEGFTLSTTIRNAGTGRSAATKVRCYQSADANISTDDTQIEIADMGAISSGGTRNKNFRIIAPDVPGTYYYGVCVDGVQNESETANNCSQAIAITVQAPALPDLVVESILASSNVVGPGENFTLFVTVRNQGTATSLPTALNYHDPNGGKIGTDRIGRLSPSEVSEQSISLRAPDRVGTYYYDACVESPLRSDESNLDNNCSVELAITVGTPTNRVPVAVGRIPTQSLVAGASRQVDVSIYFRDPDGDRLTYRASSNNTNIATANASGGIVTITPLRVGNTTVSVTASDGRLTATQRFTVEVQSGQTTQPTQPTQPTNQSPAAIGTLTPLTLIANSNARRVDVSSYFRDSDGDRLTYTARSDNTNVATVRVSGADVTITPQRAGNTMIHIAASDGVSTASQSISVTVTSTPPVQDPTSFDLAIQSVTVSKSTLTPSESFTLSITIHNNGPAASGVFALSYYYSLIQGRTSEDKIHREGTVQLDPLASGTSTTKSFRLNAPSTPRPYYYGAWLSGIADDTNIFNNVATEVGVPVINRDIQPSNLPDLVIQSVRVSESRLAPGERFRLYATVRNQGAAEANRATLRYYRSTDSSISRSDTQVDTDSVISLDPNESDEEWENLSVPNSAGTYYYGVCIDSVNDESNTSNNCSNAIRITVEVLTPDLVVESISASESTVEPGERFRLSATVRNRGSGESRSTRLRYYRSSDASISTSDTEVDTDSVSSLDADETSNEWDNITAPNTPGTYYFGACVDSVRDESNTNNNCSTAVRVTVETPGLRIRDSVFAQNTVGGGFNGLRVRSGAGTAFDQIGGVWDGATGRITDGPRTANGYTWWKIRWNASNKVACDENPCEGWSVEFFNGTRLIGKQGLAAPTLNVVIPTGMTLLPNYPNPFNPETWIPYQLSRTSDVTVSIYSVNGMLVRRLDLGYQPAGIYQSRSRAVYWNGRNEFGEPVASGLYFYTLTAGDFSATRKMLIRK
ncbi:MAG: T9SS type A sorting domain-containing protein [Candidatus Poribacteria bacterium]|nr:T9SS type A sorting domain-containing protein [Candidatus Poribacteria bacterium]